MEQIKDKKIMLLRLGIVIMILVIIIILPLIISLHIQAINTSDKIALSKTSISVKKGITEKIKVRNKPTEAKILWNSKNKKIAKVKRGVVTGLKQGETVITCKVVYNKG